MPLQVEYTVLLFQLLPVFECLHREAGPVPPNAASFDYCLAVELCEV